jgi:hypothetical protein
MAYVSKSNFSSILLVIHWFFTWIALSDVDLYFSLMLVRKANAVEEATMGSMRISAA